MTVPTISPVAPFVLKNVTLVVDTDDFKMHVSQVSFEPAGSQQTWKGLSPDAVFTDQSAPTWTLTLAYAQDWASTTSLSRYLYDHEGEVKPVTFVPDVTGQGTWTANVVITAGAVGGTVDAFATSTVTLGVQGRPLFTPPVVADPAALDVDTDTDTDPDVETGGTVQQVPRRAN